MAYRSIIAGSTSQLVDFPVYDSSSTTGALLTGLVYNSGSLTAYYSRGGVTGAATAISLVTMTKGTWTSLGFIAVDATNMPGHYQLGIPDAALAAGAPYVTIVLKGATNMVTVSLVIELPTSVVQTGDAYARLGAPAGASVSADVAAVKTDTAAVKTQTDKMTFTVANKMDSNVYTWNGTAVSTPSTAGIPEINVKNIANAAVNTSSAQIGCNVVTQANIDFGALQKTSLNAATPASVVGAVGSVTGAVGSVTGNVGGNVTGSVGSVAANGIGVTSIATDAITAATVKADAVTKIQTGLATPTNITAGIITTVTNLTNAPTNGDFTATMKTSIDTEVWAQLNTAFTDATSLNANSLLERLRILGWIQRNKIDITDATGAGTIYKDDSSTSALSVSLADNAVTTTRTRAA